MHGWLLFQTSPTHIDTQHLFFLLLYVILHFLQLVSKRMHLFSLWKNRLGVNFSWHQLTLKYIWTQKKSAENIQYNELTIFCLWHLDKGPFIYCVIKIRHLLDTPFKGFLKGTMIKHSVKGPAKYSLGNACKSSNIFFLCVCGVV